MSALSLWIDGHEAPARLTTQAKADSAYKTIVGVESRDPSMVTWQEGNRVTVRVFPVVANQARQVKIGITSPLQLAGDQLIYQNSWFEGPDATKASETVKLTFDTDPMALQMRGLSGEVMNRTLTRERDYQPPWSLQFTAPPLSPDPFRLDGKAYQVAAYVAKNEEFTPSDVYVDVNAAWKRWEFRTAYYALKGLKTTRVWVFDDGFIRLTSDNLEAIFDRLSAQRFSLFPIDRIGQPATALLVTKGTLNGPTLTDLEGSPFANRLKQVAKLDQPIRTFWFSHNDSNQLSPYLKTLQELGVLNVYRGTSCDYMHKVIGKQQFPVNTETADAVLLPGSGMVIRQTNQMQVIDNHSIVGEGQPQKASLAPDHLLRLFTYNQLMQRVGRRYFDQAYRNDGTLAAVAQMGHVVSPVSSLVVLETQKDYKRFDIKKDKNGLDNATLKQDGAVPEPHEWAMLVVIALLVGWFYVRGK